MNIILNDNTIRTTKFNKEETYELSDINIYIPNDQNHTNAYIILKNQQGIYDIIPIEFAEKTTTHKKYRRLKYHGTSITSIPRRGTWN